MSTTTYDVIVIGAGAVGENVADRAVQGGLTVAIVEKELVGGECSYWACMPSKALLRTGIALRAAEKAGVEGGTLDPAKVFARRDRFTSSYQDDGQVKWLDSAGIALVRGHARLNGERRVAVTADDGSVTQLTATHAVVVSTGSAALMPDIPGLRDAQPWSSREATSATHVPGRLAIIGGGVVALEMATAYQSLGAFVTVISRGDLLTGQEPFAGELVAESLRGMGAVIHTGTSPTSVSRIGDEVSITVEGAADVVADELIVATGRTPNTLDLGLDTVGLTAGHWLDVDDSMLVRGFEWLYAVGDVNHRALLTHQGKYQARAAGDVIAARAHSNAVHNGVWGAHSATADHEAVPQVTFTDPEVASVGLTAAAAEEAGYDIRVVDYEIGSVAGASVHADGYAGKARMIVDEKRKVVIGMTFVGPDVAELLHSATIAIVGEVPLERLWHAVPSYPTIGEVWLRLLETYGRP